MYYIGSMFRYERPQAGRLREFRKLVLSAGSANPATTLKQSCCNCSNIGNQDVTLHLNTLGSAASRAAYRQALIDC